MMEICQTGLFKKWLARLKDERAIPKIKSRLVLMEAGYFGDAQPCGEGISESRIHYVPGYRIYFIKKDKDIIVVLGGGTKRTQDRDIKKSEEIINNLGEFL